MLEDQESEFILGIFLMEAWDTVASVEDGLRRLAGGDPPSSEIVDPLVVVAHRLKGASALHGYPVVSAVALVMENLLEKLPGQPAREWGRTIEALGDVVVTVRRVLEMIGDDGREDVETVSRLRARYPELFPTHAASELPPDSLRRAEHTPASAPPKTEAVPSAPREGETAVDTKPLPPPARSVFSRPLPPPTPGAMPGGPTAELGEVAADRLLSDLERFFAEHAESVPYFAPEAAEHLEVMTRSILALEQVTGATKDEEIATLFRAVHTLKGAAYTVGCAPLGDVAHRIEDILDAVRDRRLEFEPAVFDAVLGGVDTLRLLLDGSANTTLDARLAVQRTLDVLGGGSLSSARSMSSALSGPAPCPSRATPATSKQSRRPSPPSWPPRPPRGARPSCPLCASRGARATANRGKRARASASVSIASTRS